MEGGAIKNSDISLWGGGGGSWGCFSDNTRGGIRATLTVFALRDLVGSTICVYNALNTMIYKAKM